MSMEKLSSTETGMPIRRLKKEKPSKVFIDHIYACRHDGFQFKLYVKIRKLYRSSALVEIIDYYPSDKEQVVRLDHLTVVSFKNIWWEVSRKDLEIGIK